MKNLKRALSLVLSAAMMVGMMVVGTGAAVLTDVTDKNHDEAIGTIRVLGVMEGDENGNFNPDKTVTRNEMAVIMANLAGLKLNGSHPFTDVPTWADKYVGALYTNGLTSGTSATTYGGSADITTTTAALMIMKTLGYFEFQGEFGEDWELATVKRATQLNLFKDIDAGVKESLTRGEVAQMVFNALKQDVVVMVEESGMTVSGNGITVSEKPKYEVENTWTTLSEKLYGDYVENIIDTTEAWDAVCRPGTTYSYTAPGKDAVEATIYETSDKDLVATKEITLEKLIKDAKLKYDNIPDMTVYAGYVVELFVNEDNAKLLDYVIVYYYDALEIEKVEAADEDLYKDEIADGAKYVVTMTNGDEYLDIELNGFDAKTFVKGAQVVVAVVPNRIGETGNLEGYAVEFDVEFGEHEYDVICGVTVAEKITGKATTVKGTEFATIDDVKYVYAANFTETLKAGTTYNVFVDGNGYVIAANEVTSKAVIDDVYYVANIWVKGGTDTYNNGTTTVGAQLVDMNGVVSVVALETTDKENEVAYYNGEDYAISDAAAKTAWVGQLVTISDKKWTNGKAGNEKFDLAYWTGEDWNVDAETLALNLKKDATRVAINGNTYRLNADTKYILIGDNSADIKTEVKTGGIAVYNLAADVIVICPEKAENTVSYMIVVAASEIEESAEYSKDIIFVKGTSSEKGDGFYNQTVYFADGSKKVIKVVDGDQNKTGFFKYSVNKDGYYELTAAKGITSGSYIWEDEEGVITATVTEHTALYNGLLTVDGIEDIKVADAKFVDAHDTDAGYGKTVSNLTKVMDLLEKGAISSATLNMNVSKDGAVVIIVTEMA